MTNPEVKEDHLIVFHECQGVELFAMGDHPLPQFQGRPMMRSPLLKLGEWRRGRRRAKFSQEDFDAILLHFNRNTLGFEPPLFLGHPTDFLASEGAPAAGFLVSMHQKDDVLWGDFEVVDENVLAAVRQGQYRYASAELVRNSTDPETGERVSLMLVGHALTNRPFIPRLPRNIALAAVCTPTEEESVRSNLELIMSEDSQTQKNTQDSAVVEQVKELFAAQMQELRSEYESRLAVLREENEQLRSQMATLEAQLRETQIQKRLEQLAAMNLAAPIREKYEALVRERALGEHEESIFEALQAMAQMMRSDIVQQHGQENMAMRSEEPSDGNPYYSQIEENERLAAQLRQKAQMALYGQN